MDPRPAPQVINGLVMKTEYDGGNGAITVQYNSYEGNSKVGVPATLEVDMVIGADGANSRVAKDIDAGEYDYAIAFQVRHRAGTVRCNARGCARRAAALDAAPALPTLHAPAHARPAPHRTARPRRSASASPTTR